MNRLSTMEQLFFCTTRIETEDEVGRKYSGTGFFFNLSYDDKIVPLIVTNKHVVEGMKKGQFRFTKADVNGNPIHTDHYIINIENDFDRKWIYHSSNNVDLCVYPFLPIIKLAQQTNNTIFYRTFEVPHIPTKEQQNSIDAIEDIIMIGYPNGLWDEINNMPIMRKGTTATDITIDYNGRKEFMIDAACFPGSSGSPVVVCNLGSYRTRNGNTNIGDSRFYLLGILYAGPQLTVTGEIKIVTIPTAQQMPMAIAHIPNNLGYVIKSERILDFIPIIKQIQ